jgi:uncharacterized protein (UPF0332 family)
VALPDDLLEQAHHLARLDRTRPKQANLRRAVSSAYYALFHLLVSAGIGYWKIERQRSAFARSFEHRKMKGVCKNKYPNADLQAVADAFVELQQARHSADYDYAKAFTRVEALAHINTVKNAFQQWSRINDRDFAQDFLLALFVVDRR